MNRYRSSDFLGNRNPDSGWGGDGPWHPCHRPSWEPSPWEPGREWGPYRDPDDPWPGRREYDPWEGPHWIDRHGR